MFNHVKIFLDRILRNSEWYESTSVIDFVSQAGRNIRIGDMLSRTRFSMTFPFSNFEMHYVSELNILLQLNNSYLKI